MIKTLARHIPRRIRTGLKTTKLIFKNSYEYARIQRLPTRIFGYKHHRNTKDIEIDITYDCNMKCFNCVRSCRQAPTQTEMMSIEQVRKFVRERVEKDARWRIIRVLGGEPTLHPEFLDILMVLLEYRKDHSPSTKIQVVTNGASAKTSDILERIPDGVEVINTAKTGPGQRFFAFNKAPIDSKWYTYAEFSQGCATQKLCMLLSPYGYYACAAMPGVDRPLGKDVARKSLPSPDDPMREQFSKMCRYCGFYGYGATMRTDKEIMSPTWKRIYASYRENPPKLERY